ncbi:MAG: hypothetical protein HY961_08450 [Ignavibacteriae bacterium]|nr:hypothetical protein [Ignavibacteriota bacterium]
MSLAQDVEMFSRIEKDLVAKYGESERFRLLRGMRQVYSLWQKDVDGGDAMFEAFIRKNFAGTQAELDTMFNRFEYLSEQLDGHMLEITREFRQQSDLDFGPIQPYDEVLAGYDPSAHTIDDMFANKLAFVVLLNFPLTTLEQRLSEGDKWSRRQWAEARLAQRFSKRIPAAVNLAIAEAGGKSDQYIAEYNIYMHHVLDEKGERPFPPKLRLLSHWNLRDEIKANYGQRKVGLQKQRIIQKVMDRIVTQTIPTVVINNPHVDWNPFTNAVTPAAVRDVDSPPPAMNISDAPEPDTRYAVLLQTFLASRKADPYSPSAPTHIARRFDENREIPEERVKKMCEDILTSPLVKDVAAMIEARLGRHLEPFDIWYSGFVSRGKYSEADLDKIVAKKYPTAGAYKKDIPNLLKKLGFSNDRPKFLANNIVVDPARGSGHAWGAQMRSAPTHLRTRVEKSGMNYKGFNIAIHEMGHNVEQTFSLNNVDHWLLNGVPNTAFTEALAFVFQAKALDLLGLASQDKQSDALKTVNDFWATYEIAGVALVDMEVWHWMYDHPDTTPAQLKEATLAIAKRVWNSYYAPVFYEKDVTLLGIYSHMIHSFLYLPDYPLGHLIAHQIEEQIKRNGKQGNLGREFERMATFGRVTPDLWMKHATGQPVGAEAMIEATKRALQTMKP